MNIQTVAENLRNTIAGKEKYLAEWKDVESAANRTGYDTVIGKRVIDMLEINIDELKRILQDVEQCIEETV